MDSKANQVSIFTVDNRNKISGSSGERLDDVEKMGSYWRELETLNKINSAVYAKRKVEFDNLVSGVSFYNGVGSDVRNHT